MLDLHAEAAELNARFEAARVPLTARAGKRAVKFFRHYEGALSAHGGGGYSIARGQAERLARGFGLSIKAEG